MIAAANERRQGSRRNGTFGFIRNRIIVVVVAASVIPLAAVGVYSVHGTVKALYQLAMRGAQEKAALQVRRAEDLLAGARADAVYLSQSPTTLRLLDYYEADHYFWRRKAEQKLQAVLWSRPIYRGGAFQDASGRAVVAVMRMDEEYVTMPDSPLLLQQRPEEMVPGRAYVRVVPGGLVEVYAAAPGELGWVRLLVASDLLLNEVAPPGEDVNFFLEGDRPGESVLPWPAEVARGIRQRGSGAAAVRFDKIVAFHPLRVAEDVPPWVLIRVEDGTTAFAAVRRMRFVLGIVLGAGLLAAVGFSFFLARQIGRPLEALTRSVQAFGEGDRDRRVDIRTGDETEDLAEAFNAMAEQLDELYQDLEGKVELRTEELRKALDDLKLANQRLRETERLTAMGEMAAAVAHEVNNPVGVISMNAQMAQEVGELPPEARDRLALIERHAERVGRIVGNLLEFARRGESSSDPRVVRLGRVIDRAIEDVKARKGLGRVQILASGIDPGPLVAGEEEQLFAIFDNLLVNAAQAMNGDGLIEVEVVVDGGEVRTTVRDHGPGIPEEDLNRIFEPFFTTKVHGQGTGLGLAIVKRLLRAHDGEVRVESKPGEGASFEVTLRGVAEASSLEERKQSEGTKA